MTRACCLVALSCLVASCADTGQDEVSLPLFVAGTDVTEPLNTVGDVTVFIERAQLAFGPLYLCAGFQAGDLCDTARLEWLDSVVVDATRGDEIRAGSLVGISGPVHSWMFDLGLSSQLTEREPVVLDAARQLGGVSLLLEGRAELSGVWIPFSAAVPVQQSGETELGVPVLRSGESDAFSHEVTRHDAGLVVRFDPRPWLAGVELRAFAGDTSCAPSSAGVACSGSVEQQCSDDGSVTSMRDCQTLEMVCLAERGCADRLEIAADTQAFRSIRNALTSGKRPSFEWLSNK